MPPLADGLTLVPGEKEPAVMPVPQPAYEQEGDYQYGDYQYGDYQYGDYQYAYE